MFSYNDLVKYFYLLSNTIPGPQVYELMRKCWENAPENRISFKNLVDELTRMQQRLQPQNSL